MWEDLAKVKCTSAASSFDLEDKQIDLNENKSDRWDGKWVPLIFIGFQVLGLRRRGRSASILSHQMLTRLGITVLISNRSLIFVECNCI